MLLKIYLGTTAISWVTTFTFLTTYKKRLDREGYKFINERKSFSEKIAAFISTAFKCSIPVYNIINAVGVLLMGDNLYEFVKDKLLEYGMIYKPIAEKLNNDCESQILNEEKADVYTTSDKVTKTEKTYKEMTTEEKLVYLQQERERLINQTNPQIENIFTFRKR